MKKKFMQASLLALPTLFAMSILPSSNAHQTDLMTYAQELKQWHVLCQKSLGTCSAQQACALILKHRNIQLPNSSHSSCSSDTSSTSKGTLESYIKYLEQKHEFIKKVYVLCSIEDACALILREKDSTQNNQQYFVHEIASTSCLWPSLEDLNTSAESLDRWHNICKEINPKVNFLESINLIFTHQVMTSQPTHSLKTPLYDCHKALTNRLNLIKLQVKNYDKKKACAYCLKFLKLCSPVGIQKSEDNTPQYVKNFQQKIKSLKIQSDCCNIFPTIEMNPTWQNVVCAGYPSILRQAFSEHYQYKGVSSQVVKLDHFYLLHGYPGVGKSSAGKLFAMILKSPCIIINCESIQTEWQASAIENIDRLLAPILKCKDPWVVVLEELDSLTQFNNNNSQTRVNALTKLQSLMDNNKNPNLTIIATTNYQKNLSDSVITRIGCGCIEIPLPNLDARAHIARLYLDNNQISYSKEIPTLIAKKTGGLIPGTSGLTGRDIHHIINKLKILINNEILRKKDPKLIRTPKAIEKTLKVSQCTATKQLTLQAINAYKETIAKSGASLTIQSRKWTEFRNSKDFWPTINTGIAVYNAGVSTVSTIHGIRNASLQLDLNRQSFEHQKDTTSFNKDLASKQFELNKRGLENQTIMSAYQLDISLQQLNKRDLPLRILADISGIKAEEEEAQKEFFEVINKRIEILKGIKLNEK